MATEDDLYDELEAFVAGEAADPEWDQELAPPEDAATAERYLRARARLKTEERRIGDVVTAEKARIEAWADDRLSGVHRRVEQLEKLLEGWFRAVNRDDPKRKTENLPHGTLTLRGRQYSIEATDDDALLAWAKANRPELVKVTVTEATKMGELKAATKPGPVVSEHDGVKWYAVMAADEIVPGVVLVKADSDKFDVK